MRTGEVAALVIAGVCSLVALLWLAWTVYGYATLRTERVQATLRSQRLPDGPCIRCKRQDPEAGSLWCRSCHDSIHIAREWLDQPFDPRLCFRCFETPVQVNGLWCTGCYEIVRQLDAKDFRSKDDK